MLTTPNMGLKQWDQAGDFFSFSELKLNWDAVDQHDHTTNKGVQIPTAGIANLAITGAKIAANAVDATKLAAGLDPAAGYTAYKLLKNASGSIGASANASIYAMSESAPVASALVSERTAPFWFDPADYAVAGRTVKLRLIWTIVNGANAPATTFTTGLAGPLGWSGGLASNFSTYIAGTGTTFTTPAAGSSTTTVLSDITAPVAGLYALGFTTNVAASATAATVIRAMIQLRQV
jgi:hypothetical protein